MSEYERHPPVEYEFTLPDGSKRYEVLYDRLDLRDFFKIHGAVKAEPVDYTTKGYRPAS